MIMTMQRTIREEQQWRSLVREWAERHDRDFDEVWPTALSLYDMTRREKDHEWIMRYGHLILSQAEAVGEL